ncbi:MAG: AAA family ATPase, partial [Myxococcales bacterium]|nr:AAA family ATPase [Myxococcales bacterium]
MPAAAAILDPWFCVFLSAKGGVGRSLAALNVAGILAARGLRVLVVDLDLESGLSAVIEGARGRAGVVERILTAREGARALAEV